jgi:hypothetical protein
MTWLCFFRWVSFLCSKRLAGEPTCAAGGEAMTLFALISRILTLGLGAYHFIALLRP